MTYLVITVVEVEADSVNDAAERALEYNARNGFDQFVQPKNNITEAAVEAALEGAEQAIGPVPTCPTFLAKHAGDQYSGGLQ